MIIAIDQSPLWRAQHAGKEDLSRLLEALFRSRRGLRPPAHLEIVLLARALECSEATIEQQYAQSRIPKLPAGCAGDTIATPARGCGSTGLLLMHGRSH
ncbi:MAG: hypothetical protein LAQ69_30235 [Acidobacteriia bacterium]|nr:hypothetical protein [Terriglobia bacterium]